MVESFNVALKARRTALETPFARVLGQAAHAPLLRLIARRYSGAIAQVIPEFGKLRRDHNNPFHRFTMDVHSFELISALLADPAVSVKVSDSIIIAGLLHDIAKPNTETLKDGRSQYMGHEKASAVLASTILQRLGITKNAKLIEGYIKHHMVPVQLLGELATGKLDHIAKASAARKWTTEYETKEGLDLDVFLAFGRADLLASQGPACYARFGLRETDGINALAQKIDGVITDFKTVITSVKAEKAKKKAATPNSIDGSTLTKAGFLPGPNMGALMAEAAHLEQTGLQGDALVAELKNRHPDWLQKA